MRDHAGRSLARLSAALAAALLAAGCDGALPPAAPSSERAQAEVIAPDASAAASEAPPSTEAAADERTDKVTNDLIEFSFAYPDAVGAIPQLKAIFDKRLAGARDELDAAAREDRKEAQASGFPYHAHAYDAKWSVVTDLPDWLSLSAEIYEFGGGAHGMTGFDTLLWDRRTGSARKPGDLFTSPSALRAAIQAPFCDALDQEREKRRGAPVHRDSGEMFSECIDPAEQTLILGSSNHRSFDRLGLLVAPYEAGPYAEGTYEITLPVTGKVMAALKPQYRSAFSVTP